MVDYFDDMEVQAKLKDALESWLKTPYKHHTGVKGMGCDCIHFAAGVFQEIGIVPNNLKIPPYPRDWHVHNTRELLSESIIKHLKGDLLNFSRSLKNGDIILSHYGKAASHVGIYCDGYVYQALDEVGVRKINISDKKMKGKMRFIFRTKK